MLLKIKLFIDFVEDGRRGYSRWDYCGGCTDHCSEVCSWGEKDKVQPQVQMSRWGFITKQEG